VPSLRDDECGDVGVMRYNGSEAVMSVEDVVRRADPLSVNPGQRVRG